MFFSEMSLFICLYTCFYSPFLAALGDGSWLVHCCYSVVALLVFLSVGVTESPEFVVGLPSLKYRKFSTLCI